MDKRNLIDLTIILLLLGTIIALIGDYKEMKGEGYECMQNPLVYGAKAFTEANKEEVWGNLYLKGYAQPAVQFNRTGIVRLPLTQKFDFAFELNESALEG